VLRLIDVVLAESTARVGVSYTLTKELAEVRRASRGIRRGFEPAAQRTCLEPLRPPGCLPLVNSTPAFSNAVREASGVSSFPQRRPIKVIVLSETRTNSPTS
jgi:hypothetical protein